MRRRTLAALVALSCLSQCARKPAAITKSEERPLATPQPPEPVNCVLRQGVMPAFAPAKGGDVTAIARFKRASRYAKTRRGDWDYTWFLVAYDVVRIERGSWAEKQLVFVAYDEWPAPGSNIRVKKALYPFRKGTVHAFALDSSKAPAQIVGMDERSRLPPYGAVVRPSLDEETHMKVAEAAMRFFAGRGERKGGSARIVEETDSTYIVEVGQVYVAGSDIRLLVVDKDTLAVEFLLEPKAEQEASPAAFLPLDRATPERTVRSFWWAVVNGRKAVALGCVDRDETAKGRRFPVTHTLLPLRYLDSGDATLLRLPLPRVFR